MANHNISKDNFNLELRKLQTNDKAHADTFNPLFETLINNDAVLKEDVGEVGDKLTDLGTDIKNIDLSAEKVTLDSSNLKSKNVNDAMNELFQYADSGKRGWVDAIGIPLQKTDSFTTLKNKTINVKNKLIQKLKEKGIVINDNASLEDINKNFSINKLQLIIKNENNIKNCWYDSNTNKFNLLEKYRYRDEIYLCSYNKSGDRISETLFYDQDKNYYIYNITKLNNGYGCFCGCSYRHDGEGHHNYYITFLDECGNIQLNYEIRHGTEDSYSEITNAIFDRDTNICYFLHYSNIEKISKYGVIKKVEYNTNCEYATISGIIYNDKKYILLAARNYSYGIVYDIDLNKISSFNTGTLEFNKCNKFQEHISAEIYDKNYILIMDNYQLIKSVQNTDRYDQFICGKNFYIKKHDGFYFVYCYKNNKLINVSTPCYLYDNDYIEYVYSDSDSAFKVFKQL